MKLAATIISAASAIRRRSRKLNASRSSPAISTLLCAFCSAVITSIATNHAGGEPVMRSSAESGVSRIGSAIQPRNRTHGVERVPEQQAGEIRHPRERAEGQRKRRAVPEVVPVLGEILDVEVLMPDEMRERLPEDDVVVVVRVRIVRAVSTTTAEPRRSRRAGDSRPSRTRGSSVSRELSWASALYFIEEPG